MYGQFFAGGGRWTVCPNNSRKLPKFLRNSQKGMRVTQCNNIGLQIFIIRSMAFWHIVVPWCWGGCVGLLLEIVYKKSPVCVVTKSYRVIECMITLILNKNQREFIRQFILVFILDLDFLKLLRFSFPVPVVGPGANSLRGRRSKGKGKGILPSRSPFNARHAGYSVKDFYPLQRAKFPPVGFIQSRTVLPMHRQSNPITPHETFLNCFDPSSIKLCIFFGLYFDFVLSRVFKYKALVGDLSSFIRALYQGWIFLAATEQKRYRRVLLWAHALQSFYFFMFCFMAYANLATILTHLNSNDEGLGPKHLETELTNITRRHFCSLPVFCIEHFFIYFTHFLS